MSLTPHKVTDSPRKNFYENVKEVDFEKAFEGVDSGDNTTRPPGGAGETPVKKLVKKATKPEDDKTGKKIGSAVVDKIPKKNAQRAKGSIALNKTIPDGPEKKKPVGESNDVPQMKEGAHADNVKSAFDGRKTPISVRNNSSKTKTSIRKVGKKEAKSSKGPKPWMDAVEKLSNEVLKTSEGVMAKEEPESEAAELHPLSPPFATCSFFEKLQQGVKSYFSSKNSFTPYDKVKKEGELLNESSATLFAAATAATLVAAALTFTRSQTRARVAKGVKEDAKKRDPGLIVKNDNCSSESDSYQDELRLNSNLGGQSNNFSSTKPKIFRMLKRKKLYHPKKHYVRIQIPRKGYFYRSTVQLKDPGSPSSDQFERMEPEDVPKSKSKIQISGLASTSSKVSSLPNKKRLNQKKGNVMDLGEWKKDAVSPEILDQINYASLRRRTTTTTYNPHQMVIDYFFFHWPEFPSKKKILPEGDLVLELIEPELVGEKQMSAIQDNLSNSDDQKAINRKQKSFRLVGESPEISERVCSSVKNERTPSESSYSTLMSCISSTLGNDNRLCDLEITPIATKKPDAAREMEYNVNTSTLPTKPLDFTEIMAALNSFDCDRENSVESDILFLSPDPSKTADHSANGLSASFMEELDLHMELQNYLEQYNMIRKKKNAGESDTESEEKYPVFQKGHSRSSRTSTSSRPTIGGEENHPCLSLDRKREMIISLSEECISGRLTRGLRSRNEFGDGSDKLRKTRSETDPAKLPLEKYAKSSIRRTFGKTSVQMIHQCDKDILNPRDLPSVSKDFLMEDSIESYDKITPFDTASSKNCVDGKSKNRSRVLFENTVYSQSADSMSQRVRKASSDVHPSILETFDQFLLVKPQVEKESRSSRTPSPDSTKSNSRWSPTLQDLIDIYNSVLKTNKNVDSVSENSLLKNSFSSQLISFLNEKLREKQFKADLLNLKKNLSSSCRPPSNWKPLSLHNDSVEVKEYVSMFQKILQSSLTISQITRLNDIINDLQNYSEKNYNVFKDLRKTTDAETETEWTTRTPQKGPKGKGTESRTRKVGGKKNKSFSKQKPGGDSEKTSREKTHDNDLECMLKTCFDSVNVLENNPETTPTGSAECKGKNKVMVTVKLSGNRILVDDLTYINGEEDFSKGENKPEGTSELIIESVTSDQLKDAWYETKCSKLKTYTRYQGKETPKKVEPKSKKAKVPKVKKVQRPKTAKAKVVINDSETEDSSGPESQFVKSSNVILPFEYDQIQLRAQHPIEPIVESSESKVSGTVESWEGERPKPTPSGKKLLTKKVSKSGTPIKSLKECLGEPIFSKDLVRNFEWNTNEVAGSLGRTKSSVIRRQMTRAQTAKKKVRAENVRSMVELNGRPCTKRKGRKAPPAQLRESYMCYSSSFSVKSNPKSKEKFRDRNSIKRYAPLRATPKHISSSNGKSEVHKNSDSGFKRQMLDTVELDMVESKAATSNLKTASKADLHFNGKVVRKRSSAEVIMEGTSKNQSHLSIFSFLEKQWSRNLSQHNSGAFQKKTSNFKPSSKESLDRAFEMPITLHPTTSNIDNVSFPTGIVRSDTFLKSLSYLAMAPSKFESIFKSNSDTKFYPGRVNKSGDDVNSLVTFVLTPKQKEAAGLPPHKVQVVTKPPADGVSKVANDHQGFDADNDETDASETKSLESIERFINQCLKSRRKAKAEAKKKNQQRALKQSLTSLNQRKKILPETSTTSGSSTEKKVYRECQKRKKTLAKIDLKIKKGKEEGVEVKKVKIVEKKDQNEKVPLLFPNKFKDFIKLLEDYEKSFKEDRTERKNNDDTKKDFTQVINGEELAETLVSKRTEEGECSSEISPPDFLPNVLEAINNALAQVEDIKNKSQIITMVEKELTKKQTKVEPTVAKPVTPTSPKTSKAIRIKIHCTERKTSEVTFKDENKLDQGPREKRDPSEGSQIDPLNSLVSNEAEVDLERRNSINFDALERRNSINFDALERRNSINFDALERRNSINFDALERRNSMYFDALEKTFPDEIGWVEEEVVDSQGVLQRLKEGLDLNAEFGVMEEPKSTPFQHLLTDSDDNFLSRSVLSKESEEKILNRISESLKEDRISYSTALLDEFIRKIESTSNQKKSCAKLKKMLSLVEDKSKNLIMNLEKNAWVKVLSLLEEVSQIFETEDINGSMRNHLHLTKAFMEKIRELNASRLSDFNRFCCAFTQYQPSKPEETSSKSSVFGIIRNSLHYLKQKFTLKHGPSRKNAKTGTQDKCKTRSALCVPEWHRETELLKKTATELSMEELMKPDYDFTPEEIRDMRDQVAKKMKWLECVFEVQKWSGENINMTKTWDKSTSPLREAKRGEERSRDNILKSDSSNQNFNCSDMMQNLEKAWDTRMPLNSTSNDCFR